MAVVGSGNSGAQILAEVASAQLSEGRRGRGGGSGGGGGESSLLWSTMGDPSFLPMELTGKDIFDNGERDTYERKEKEKKKRLHLGKGGEKGGVVRWGSLETGGGEGGYGRAVFVVGRFRVQ